MTTVWLQRRVMLIVLAALLVACAEDEDVEPASTALVAADGAAQPHAVGEASTVQVVLTEWAVQPGVAQVAPGEVTFKISNNGWVPHRFAIVRTDLAADALPVLRGRVDEQRVAVVGQVDEFFGLETKEITLTLEAGSYLLVCNSLAHYQLGVRTAFRVE